MVTATRWETEKKLMEQVLPQFVPFSSGEAFGFQGMLRGPRTGQIYHVTVQAKVKLYPLIEPSIFVEPRPEPHVHNPDGSLSYLSAWQPRSCSFAGTALIAAKYIAKSDGYQG